MKSSNTNLYFQGFVDFETPIVEALTDPPEDRDRRQRQANTRCAFGRFEQGLDELVGKPSGAETNFEAQRLAFELCDSVRSFVPRG